MSSSKSFDAWVRAGYENPPRYLTRGSMRWRHTAARIALDWGRVDTWGSPDVETDMNSLGGPFIEIAGPSLAREVGESGGHIYDTAKLNQPFHITNRSTELLGNTVVASRWPFHRSVTATREEQARRLALFADATAMPFRAGSVGALAATALYRGDEPLFESFFREARRALKLGGFVIAESIGEPHIDALTNLGFEPVRARRRWFAPQEETGFPMTQFDVIARKPMK